MSRLRRRSITPAPAIFGVSVLLLGVLAWPLLFTSSGFTGDWMHHLWRVWHQSLSIRSGQFPSLFINSSYSVFDPVFAFYGGTLYALTGLLSLALGEAPLQAYVCMYILGMAAALGGWYWLSRMAGLGRWLAMAPGLVFVTSAYYVLLVYVRGDWPEFTGVSMIPLMIAASWSVLRADHLRVGAGVALALSSVLFFGSHNITILLGLTMFALTGLAILIGVPDVRRQITRRGIVRVTGVVVPSALVSAWYLLPALAYQSRTHIGSNYAGKQEALRFSAGYVSLGHLLTFSRASVTGPPFSFPFVLALPVLAIAWVLAGMLVLPRHGNRAWARLIVIFSALALLAAVVMTHVGILLALPHVYSMIQFSYRLESYVLLELCGAILAALVLARGRAPRARIWKWMAVPVCIVSLIGSIVQITAYPESESNRNTALQSYDEYAGASEDYQDVSGTVINGRGLPKLEIPLSAIHDGRASVEVRARPGTLAATNIAAGAYLVHISGAQPVGIDSLTDQMVLRVGSATAVPTSVGTAHQATGRTPLERISVSTGHSLPIVLGRLLTLAALVVLALELLLVPLVRVLARRTHKSRDHDQQAAVREAATELTRSNV